MKEGFTRVVGILAARRVCKPIAFVILSAMGMVTGSVARAQVSTAALNGTIHDNTGALVPRAKIVAIQTRTNFTTETTTGPDGSFRVSSIPVGPYVIRVSKEGFAQYEQSGIVLTVGQEATLEITLAVGSVSQNIVVTAEASPVESTDSTIQNVVEDQAVINLPLNGRNPAALMNTVPGVTDAALNPQSTTPNSTVKTGMNLDDESAPTTNGVRPGGTYFSLDGAGNVDPFNVIGGPFPNPDATQEFAVVTGSYGARYVSAPGGAVNVITKSGGNEFHGSVFEFVRNGYFNARNDFSNSPDILKRNQYGFAAGGPILKNKLFVFGSYQETNIRSSSLINTYVGTPDMQKGNFINTTTGATVTIPMSTVAKNLLQYVPAPNSQGVFYKTTTPYRNDEPQWVARVDYNLGQNRVFARYFGERSTIPANNMKNKNVLTASQGNKRSWATVALGDTWTSKSGSWIVDARASYLKGDQTGYPAPNLASLNIQALGATNVTPGVNPTLPIFCCSLFVAGGSTGSTPRTSWDYTVDVLHPVGKHELSFGTDIRIVGLNESGDTGENPGFEFFGVASRILFGNLNDNGFADMVLGKPTVFLQQDGYFSVVHGHLFGFYGEDKYRLSDRVTSLADFAGIRTFLSRLRGIRSIAGAPVKQSKVYTNAPTGLIFPGDDGCEAGGTTAKYMIVQPRLGVAYRVDQKGNTAVRAGWGMYSTQPQLQSFIGFSAPPFVRSFLIVNPFQSLDDPWGSNGLSNPFSNGFHGANYVPPSDVSFAQAVLAGFNISAIDKNFRPGYAEQWTLSLQHAFTPSDSAELAYVGTEGVHLSQTYDANLSVFGPGATAANERARRPYASEGLLTIKTLRSDATSSYNGLNATFRHRSKGGIELVSGFNWSKCLDDGSWPASTLQTTANGNDPRLRRGLCDFDQDLTFRNTVLWKSPALNGNNKLLRTVAGSWMVSGLVTADAGQPFSVTDSADYSYTGNGLDLADRVAGVPTYVNGRLNYAAFTHNAPGTYGDSGRNSFRSPKNVDVDAAVMKSFPLVTERTQLIFRAEAFNMSNHPNLLAPSADYNANPNTFGIITAARDPRIMQFSLKLMF